MWFLDLTKFGFRGNFFDGTVVSDVGLIAPGTTVEKAGGSTGITEGVVDGCAMRVWSEGCETKEIVVIGVNLPFAKQGDSDGILVSMRGMGQIVRLRK